MAVSLVTGGAGFIGSHIVEALLKRGDEVRVFDNFTTGKRENLATVKGKVQVVEGDIRDRGEVVEAVKGVDIIFHQAAFISAPLSLEQPRDCFDINVQGTQNLLEAARDAGVGRVVLASSAAVYGDNQSIPLNENTPLRALSPYAASKQTNEIFADFYSRVYNLPVVALRYFNVYGPRQSPTSDYAAVIPIFIRNLLDGERPTVFGDGGQTRDFIYIEDVVRANLTAAEHPQAAGKIFNLCAGAGVSILGLLKILTEIYPNYLEPKFASARAGDLYHSVGAAELIESVIGFNAKTLLMDGLRKTMDWMA